MKRDKKRRLNKNHVLEMSTWKKIISIVGLLTIEIGHLINEPVLMIVGLTSSIAGIILMFIIK